MDKEIKHKYSDIDRLTLPVVDKPFSKDEFMRLVREGVKKLFTRTDHLLKINRCYAIVLDKYLTKYKLSKIIPDEEFIEKMRLVLIDDGLINERGNPYRIMTRKKISRFTRQVINEYFYPNGYVKRKLLLEIGKQKYVKFLSLTKNSQEAIKWFEENGRVVKALPVYVESNDANNPKGRGKSNIKRIMKVEDRKLLPIPNATKIQQAMLFLRIIDKKGFEFVDESDVEKLEEYCDQRKLKKKQDYLADVATFLANIHEAGFVKFNAFSHVSLKKNTYSSVKNDFFSPDAIGKIKDISTIDYKNKLEVRDRLFALLGYDLALRLNEILSLRVSDFQKDSDGELYVQLRPEIQKGTKNENVLYFFFDETKELLGKYLKSIRPEFIPQTDHLILTQYGKSLNDNRCRLAFQALCKKLDINTFYGKRPSPHCLRHSFATLNIEPLGLSLPLGGIMERLRHTRSEIAERHYIHDNPYLKKMKHKVYKKRVKKETISEKLDQVPLADLEHWLSDRVGLDVSIIELIRRKHKIAFSKKEPVIDKVQDNTKIYITEDEALKRLSHLDISSRSLRQFARQKGAIAEGAVGSARYGNNYKYKEEIIEDLAENWVSFQTIMKKLGLSKSVFWRKARKEMWKILKIGQCTYVRKSDLF